MASHCHHHHHHCRATPAAASSCHCCCGCSCTPPQPPLATAATDPFLLQAIAAQLLQSPPPPIYSNQYLQSLHYLYPNPSPPPPPEPQHQWHQKQTDQHLHREKHNHQHQGDKDLVQTLLQRISVLESSLPQTRSCAAPLPDPAQTAPNPTKPADRPGRDSLPRPAPPPRRVASSVRDAAARVIQSEFRLYLIRRSQTLRDLKQLATIRAQVATLKLSLHFDSRQPQLLDLKGAQIRAVHLLEKLDYIQSSDSMIREGKRSVRLEIEELQARSQQFSKPITRRIYFSDGSFMDAEVEGHADEEGNDTSSIDTDEALHRLKDLGKSGGKPGLNAPVPVKMESRRSDSGDSAN